MTPCETCKDLTTEQEAALLEDGMAHGERHEWVDGVWFTLPVHPCGHAQVQRGCGGCDPSAIEFVIPDDGVRRPFDPTQDMLPADQGGTE